MNKVRLRGIVISGLNEGAYYVEQYSENFEKILGIKPYPGTLNILLDECIDEVLCGVKSLIIQPPRPGLGIVYGYRGYIGNIEVLIVKPSITRHDCRILEVVAPVHLRSILGLKDNDSVEIEILIE